MVRFTPRHHIPPPINPVNYIMYISFETLFWPALFSDAVLISKYSFETLQIRRVSFYIYITANTLSIKGFRNFVGNKFYGSARRK